MKPIATLLLFTLMAFTAQAQNSYAEAIQQGDAALRRGQYKTAINKYFAAEAFDPSKKAVVKARVNRAFDKIEALRRQAQDALAQVKEEQGKTKAALAKANKLIDAFYFYEGRFALAFKDSEFYFIDKNGDPVTKLDRWDKAEQFEGWGFARVSKRQKAYLLDTMGNTYPVAYGIEDLGPEITALDLSGKRLRQLPEEVFQHPQLKILLLYSNRLEDLPAEISGLKNLIHLNLENNNLRSLPEQIGDMESLSKLVLSSNRLTSLPAQIGGLKNLTALDLFANKLTNLPVQIGDLKNLTFLDLRVNQLTSLPAQIGNLKNLAYLKLDLNKLRSLPAEIWTFKKLTSLGLSYCQLRTLPEQIGDMKKMTSMNLSENRLTSLPVQIGALKKLTTLDLRYNPIPKEEQEKIKKLLPACEITF